MAFNPSNPTGTSRTNGFSDKDLALKVFSGEVLTAFDTKNVFLDKVTVRTIESGKSAQFPLIGKATNAVATHTPGEDVSINTIGAGEKTITINDLKTDAVFIDSFEEKMAHFEVRSEYSRQLGENVAKDIDNSIISALDACIGGTAGEGQPSVQATAADAGVLIADSASEAGNKILGALFDAQASLDEKDIPGEKYIVLRPSDRNKLVQSNAIDKDLTNNNGGLDSGNIEMVAGMKIITSNNIAANTVYVFTEKAVGVVKLLDIKTEAEYKIEKQGTLVVTSVAMGFGVLNPGCAYKIDTTAN